MLTLIYMRGTSALLVHMCAYLSAIFMFIIHKMWVMINHNICVHHLKLIRKDPSKNPDMCICMYPTSGHACISTYIDC